MKFETIRNKAYRSSSSLNRTRLSSKYSLYLNPIFEKKKNSRHVDPLLLLFFAKRTIALDGIVLVEVGVTEDTGTPNVTHPKTSNYHNKEQNYSIQLTRKVCTTREPS